MSGTRIAGGCQCGAVRFACEALGRASICHCRMCQKAFGGFYGPLVTARGLTWTRGAPGWFNSSNKVRRGFCAACGTPLAYDWGGDMEIAIGALDNPELAPPAIQVNPADTYLTPSEPGTFPVSALISWNMSPATTYPTPMSNFSLSSSSIVKANGPS